MTAIYRVGDRGYCSAHRLQATERLAKFGNPKAAKHKPSPVRLVHVDKPTTKEQKAAFRQSLRDNPTPAEKALRELLTNHPQTKGLYQFQPSVEGYFPDFLCKRHRLIIEVDGWHHRTTAGKRADARRTGHLESKGYRVIRFMNRHVLEAPENVMKAILLEQCARLGNDVGRVSEA